MQDHTVIEDQVSARREIRRLRFKEVMRHEFEASLQIQWQRFFAWLECLCVVLDDEIKVWKSGCNAPTDMTTASSDLSPQDTQLAMSTKRL